MNPSFIDKYSTGSSHTNISKKEYTSVHSVYYDEQSDSEARDIDRYLFTPFRTMEMNFDGQYVKYDDAIAQISKLDDKVISQRSKINEYQHQIKCYKLYKEQDESIISGLDGSVSNWSYSCGVLFIMCVMLIGVMVLV